LVGAGGSVLWQRVRAGEGEAVLSDEPIAQANAQPPQKPNVSRPPAETKPVAAQEVEHLRKELANAEEEYRAVEDSWDRRMADVPTEFRRQAGERRAIKARLAIEAKRTSRALEMAESRYEKLTHVLDTTLQGDALFGQLQKKQQEAQKQ